MINALFQQTNYAASKKFLDLTAARQEAIQANLANIETPNYKRVDVAPRFEEQLRSAISSGDPTSLAGVRPQVIQDATAVSARRDGNTVQLESELLHLGQNSMEHALNTQLVTRRLSRLRLAITGRSA